MPRALCQWLENLGKLPIAPGWLSPILNLPGQRSLRSPGWIGQNHLFWAHGVRRFVLALSSAWKCVSASEGFGRTSTEADSWRVGNNQQTAFIRRNPALFGSGAIRPVSAHSPSSADRTACKHSRNPFSAWVWNRSYSGNPTLFLITFTRGSPRIRSSSGKLRILPTLTGPNTVM